MKISKRIVPLFAASLFLAAAGLSACGNKPSQTNNKPRSEVTITVLNGEHYSVIGDNKKSVKRGDDAVYQITVDRGYELVSSFGKQCEFTAFRDNRSFVQTVTFPSVNYDTSVTLSVQELEVTEFTVSSNVGECTVEIQSAAGQPDEGELYVDDEISLYAIPAQGYRFHCWSTGNYLTAGGQYYSNESILSEFDFNSTKALYANFKSTSDSARTIVYDFGEGIEIEQDCSPMLAYHYRANTLTEPELIEKGVELPQDKMLAGWQTESGEYVGLGWRTEVSDETFVRLYPVWKQYTDASRFTVSDGVITNYSGTADGETEVVIPKSVNGQTVTGIASNAFENCAAQTYYLPNTLNAVSENAFLNCTAFTDLYMSDNITGISDASFTGCLNFERLHLNAFMKPRYMIDLAQLKGENLDKIIRDKDEPKCVVLGGSSVTYGYNVSLSEELLKGKYNVYNIGYNMSMCGYAYYDIFDDYLQEGDIFVHAAEQAARSWCAETSVSKLTNQVAFRISYLYLFYICESNWQLLSTMQMNKYSNFFNQFASLNNLRRNMTPREYYEHLPVISQGQVGGELITGEQVYYSCGIAGYNFGLNGNLSFNTTDMSMRMGTVFLYEPVIARGVNVCVAFPPMNRHNLYKTYGNEETLQAAAMQYTQRVKNIVSSDVIVLLSQYDTIYNGECFVNSDYHLGYPYRDEHTTKIMTAIAEALHL